MELICTNGKSDSGTKFISPEWPEFCVPFAQTVIRQVCPCNYMVNNSCLVGVESACLFTNSFSGFSQDCASTCRCCISRMGWFCFKIISLYFEMLARSFYNYISCLQLCYTWPRQVPLGRRACRLECMYRIKLKSGLNRTSRRQNCTKGSPKACLNQYSIHRQSLKVSLNRKGRSTSLLLNFVSSITSLQPLEIHRRTQSWLKM